MLIEELKALIEPEVEALGFILWGIEVDGSSTHAGSMTLRIFIDYEEGISVDDCQEVSHAVSAILDVEDPISGAYTLEVSSPGVNRRVFSAIQAKSLVGFIVKVELTHLLDQLNRKKFKGTIKDVEGDFVTLSTDEGEVKFDFSSVDKMRVVPNF